MHITDSGLLLQTELHGQSVSISVGKKTVSPANGWTNRDVISTESWRSNMNFEVSWAKTRPILTLAQFEFKTLPGSVETL